MNTNELFNHIDNARTNALKKHNAEKKRDYDYIMSLAEKVKAHTKDVAELCKLINYAIEKGYVIQCHSDFSNGAKINAPRLQSDGIKHGFGFVGDKRCVNMFGLDFSARFHQIGMCGGGCAIDTLTLDENGVILFGRKLIEGYDSDAKYPFTDNYIWSGVETRLTQFIELFPTFKEQVLNFIENIDKYQCYH